MSETNHTANQEQAALWNDAAGHAWVEMETVLDGMLAPFNTLLTDAPPTNQPRTDTNTTRLLDIGCGAGATTLAVARSMKTKPTGQCLGVDISAPLIELATRRALEAALDNVKFVRADAQTYAFEPNSFDSVISRFGVMFFDDPQGAFANIRRATRRGGKLAFVAWRGPAENPFMTAAARAAAPLLPSLPVPDPNTPGQFGFADPGKARRILEASGWTHIDIRPKDVPSELAKKDLLTYVTRLGPVGLALQKADEPTRNRTTAAVRAAFEPFIHGDVVRFTGACWLVTAHA